jgi:hypothetical protein
MRLLMKCQDSAKMTLITNSSKKLLWLSTNFILKTIIQNKFSTFEERLD